MLLDGLTISCNLTIYIKTLMVTNKPLRFRSESLCSLVSELSDGGDCNGENAPAATVEIAASDHREKGDEDDGGTVPAGRVGVGEKFPGVDNSSCTASGCMGSDEVLPFTTGEDDAGHSVRSEAGVSSFLFPLSQPRGNSEEAGDAMSLDSGGSPQKRVVQLEPLATTGVTMS
jgi:hypothetical protein